MRVVSRSNHFEGLELENWKSSNAQQLDMRIVVATVLDQPASLLQHRTCIALVDEGTLQRLTCDGSWPTADTCGVGRDAADVGGRCRVCICTCRASVGLHLS